MSENNEMTPSELPEDESAEGTSPAVETDVSEEVFVEEPQARPEMPPSPDRSLDDTPGTPPTDADDTKAVKKPSRFQAALRRFLIWFAVVAVFFLGGFLTYYFVFYRPVAAELKTAQAEVSSLQSQLDSANSQLADMEDGRSHRDLLLVLVDVYDARVALTEDNVVAAKSALADTSEILDDVYDQIDAFDSSLAATLQPRLDLIISNLDRDPETAIADCDQLIEDLLEVEAALYK